MARSVGHAFREEFGDDPEHAWNSWVSVPAWITEQLERPAQARPPLAQRQVVFIGTAVITMPLDPMGVEELFEAGRVGGDGLFLIEANRILVEVERDRDDLIAALAAGASHASLACTAVPVSVARDVGHTLLAGTALCIGAMFVGLALPTANASGLAGVAPAPPAGTVEIGLAASLLTSAGVA